MGEKRDFHSPEGGKLYCEDDSVFDLTGHLKDGTQTRNGQDNQRSFDPAVYSVLTSVLKELVNIKNELINIKEGE